METALGSLAPARGGHRRRSWLDMRYGWITPAFDAVAPSVLRGPASGDVRRPSQLILVRWHLAILSALIVIGMIAATETEPALEELACRSSPPATRSGRSSGFAAATCRLFPATVAITWRWPLRFCGAKGPVTHYVHSFFRDYPRIRLEGSALADWDTPLDAYVRASAFRIAGLGPDSTIEARIVVAKACSFVLNLLALPALYIFARRRYGCRVGIWAMAALAVLPVHAIYAGFILRESLVMLLSVLAVWTLTEVWHVGRTGKAAWAWAFAGGLAAADWPCSRA